MIPLGTAHPTCDHCGEPLGDLKIFGRPVDELTGDIDQITFQLPVAVDRYTHQPRHKCRAATPLPVAENDKPPPEEAGAVEDNVRRLPRAVGY